MRFLSAIVLAASLFASQVAPASASSTQQAMFEPSQQLFVDPASTLQKLREFGVDIVRVSVRWSAIAPNPVSRTRPRRFNAANPGAYPKGIWGQLDYIVTLAQADGMTVNFQVGDAAPVWATSPGAPGNKPYQNWAPSAGEFGQFVRAVATRYSGSYVPPGSATPLPRVTSWAIWNEPNYGPSLAPQGLPGNLSVEHSPAMYRGLVDAAWTALHATGHGGDTILFGEVAPRGYPNPEAPTATFGVFSGMKPLVFLRALYCVDSGYNQLRGTAASLRGCPTTAAGSAAFRSQHPGLFGATGFADHPYTRWYQPNIEAHPDADYTSLPELGALERTLDRLVRVYHGTTRFPIYNTEYGYITSPPKHPTKLLPIIPQSTAAYYLNWAEYISWRNPRLRTTNQYLLSDPAPALKSNDWGGFASGLLSYRGDGKGRPKATYYAYRLPLYLPVTTGRRGSSLEVWGCLRAAKYAVFDTGLSQTGEIQFQPQAGGNFKTVKPVTITDPNNCYFDVHVAFPGSGSVRLAYMYPAIDPFLPANYTVFSRSVQVALQ
jgi:hypothetical protein